MTRPGCARHNFWALCRDRVLRVVTWFPGQLGGMGYNRGFLCHDRDFSVPCHNRNSVSQQGLGLGKFGSRQESPYVATKFFPRVGHSCHDRRLYVVIGFPRVVLQ